jgi:hypothetical protein
MSEFNKFFWLGISQDTLQKAEKIIDGMDFVSLTSFVYEQCDDKNLFAIREVLSARKRKID